MKMTSKKKMTSKLKTNSKTLPENCFDDSSSWQAVLQNQKWNQLSKPEIEFDAMKEMYLELGMHTWSEETTFLGCFTAHNLNDFFII